MNELLSTHECDCGCNNCEEINHDTPCRRCIRNVVNEGPVGKFSKWRQPTSPGNTAQIPEGYAMVDHDTWKAMMSFRVKPCRYINSESNTSFKSEADPPLSRSNNENSNVTNFMSKVQNLMNYDPESTFLKRIKEKYLEQYQQGQNVINFVPYVCKKCIDKSKHILKLGEQLNSGRFQLSAEEPDNKSCNCSNKQQTGVKGISNKKKSLLCIDMETSREDSKMYHLQIEEKNTADTSGESKVRKSKKSYHVSRSKRAVKCRGRKRRNVTEKYESQMNFEPTLKRPQENSCERCWKYASPSRSPVNKPDQRYNPNFRRAHSCTDFVSSDVAGHHISPCKNLQPVIANEVSFPLLKRSSHRTSKTVDHSTELKELFSDSNLSRSPEKSFRRRQTSDMYFPGVQSDKNLEITETAEKCYQNGQTSERVFLKDQALERSFQRDQTPEMNFQTSQSPGRSFQRSNTPGRSFQRPQTPEMIFQRSQSPEMSYQRSQTPGRSFQKSQAPEMNFQRAQTPEMRFQRSKSPEMSYQRSQTPERSFQKSQTPEMSFQRAQTPGRSFQRPQSPEMSYQRSQTPGRSFQRSQTPEMNFQRVRTPEMSYQRNQTPERSFQMSQAPEMSFQRAQTPGRSFQRSQCPEMSYQRTKTPERSFQQSQAPEMSFQRAQSPEMSYRRTLSPGRSFQRSQTPEMNFQRAQTPERSFQRSQAPEMNFQRTQTPEMIFQRSQSPEMCYQRSQSPGRSFQKSQTPEMKFQRAQTPEMSFQRSQSPEMSFQRSQSPEMSYQRSQTPERSFQKSQAPEMSFRRSQSPGRSFQRSQSPGRSFQRSQTPDMSFQRSQSPEMNFQRPQSPEMSFHTSQSPEKSYQRAQTPEMSFQRSRSTKRSFQRSQSPEKSFQRSQSPEKSFQRSQTPEMSFRRVQQSEKIDQRSPKSEIGFQRDQVCERNLQRDQTGEGNFQTLQTLEASSHRPQIGYLGGMFEQRRNMDDPRRVEAPRSPNLIYSKDHRPRAQSFKPAVPQPLNLSDMSWESTQYREIRRSDERAMRSRTQALSSGRYSNNFSRQNNHSHSSSKKRISSRGATFGNSKSSASSPRGSRRLNSSKRTQRSSISTVQGDAFVPSKTSTPKRPATAGGRTSKGNGSPPSKSRSPKTNFKCIRGRSFLKEFSDVAPSNVVEDRHSQNYKAEPVPTRRRISLMHSDGFYNQPQPKCVSFPLMTDSHEIRPCHCFPNNSLARANVNAPILCCHCCHGEVKANQTQGSETRDPFSFLQNGMYDRTFEEQNYDLSDNQFRSNFDPNDFTQDPTLSVDSFQFLPEPTDEKITYSEEQYSNAPPPLRRVEGMENLGELKDENSFPVANENFRDHRSTYPPTKYCVFYMTKNKNEGNEVEVLVEELTQKVSSNDYSKTKDLTDKMKRVLECQSDSMALRFQKGISDSRKIPPSSRILYF